MRKVFVCVMSLLIGLFMAPAAKADVVAGDSIVITQGVGGANYGGSFNVAENGTIQFSTFCLERNEYFYPGQTYQVTSITTGAINGGISGGNPDQLDTRTAFLFNRWSTGQIAHTAANANALQLAIWALEGEWSQVLPDTALGYYNMSKETDGSLYGVMVMNLWGPIPGGLGNAQDMLIQTPVPAAVWLLGSALLGLIGIRRIRK
jgi:hypothetical protein